MPAVPLPIAGREAVDVRRIGQGWAAERPTAAAWRRLFRLLSTVALPTKVPVRRVLRFLVLPIYLLLFFTLFFQGLLYPERNVGLQRHLRALPSSTEPRTPIFERVSIASDGTPGPC